MGKLFAMSLVDIFVIEASLVTPLVQQHTVALPPAPVMLAVIAFGLLCGLPEVLLATPLAVVAIVLVRLLYVEAVLGKKEEAMIHGED